MLNEQTLRGNWNEISGQIRKKWGQVSGDELDRAKGNIDQLIGVIQRKTGEARSSIESFFDDMSEGAGSTIGNTAEAARQYAHDAADSLREGYSQAEDMIKDGYHQAEDMVRQRPAESVAVCFGAGMLVGVLFGLMIRPR